MRSVAKILEYVGALLAVWFTANLLGILLAHMVLEWLK